MLSAIVSGLFLGAVYGLLAVGLVLVYKGTRVFNFAQGEFGTVAAYTMFTLVENARLPYPLALLVGLLAALVMGLLVERAVVRPLLDAPRITLLVATVGVALLSISLTILFAKPQPRNIRPLIAGDPINILGTLVSRQQILIVLVLAALGAVLGLFFSKTDLGLAVLATSQDALATRVVGISVPGMSRFIWALAAVLGGVAGMLQAPVFSVFQPGFMTTSSLIPAFTAAVLGGMDSLPGAFVGGQLVGIGQSLGIYFLNKRSIPGAAETTVFALLLLVLLIRPQGILGKETA